MSTNLNARAPAQPLVFNYDDTMVRPYVKAALDGLQGSGKSVTAAKIVIGIYRAFGVKGPVLAFDNEKSAKFLRPLMKQEGIKMGVVESESLDVLQSAI